MRHLIWVLTVSLLACQSAGSSAQNETNPAQPAVAASPTTEPNSLPAPTLRISPQEVYGDLGQLTFSQEEQTMFFYRFDAEEGTVVLDGSPYVLNAYVSQEEGYDLSGPNVNIHVKNCSFEENEGTDCFYGNCATATISLGGATLTLENLRVQECPNY